MSGTKFDDGKPKMHLLSPAFLWEMAHVLTHGANVHGENNWRDVENAVARYTSALGRHVVMVQEYGMKFDGDTGFSHYAHIAVNAMFLWFFETHRSIYGIGQCKCEVCHGNASATP